MDVWIKSGVPEKSYSPDQKIAAAFWEADLADRVMSGGPETILQVSQNYLLGEPCWDHLPVEDEGKINISQGRLSLHTVTSTVNARRARFVLSCLQSVWAFAISRLTQNVFDSEAEVSAKRAKSIWRPSRTNRKDVRTNAIMPEELQDTLRAQLGDAKTRLP